MYAGQESRIVHAADGKGGHPQTLTFQCAQDHLTYIGWTLATLPQDIIM